MRYNFNTEDEVRARAALLLYAIYRSRPASSPLNGLETWDRFATFIRAASLKASTTAQFLQTFCRKAGVTSIRPRYLTTGDPVPLSGGALVQSAEVKDYRVPVFEDDTLLPTYASEGVLLTMLVRERIQREKMEGAANDDEFED